MNVDTVSEFNEAVEGFNQTATKILSYYETLKQQYRPGSEPYSINHELGGWDWSFRA